MLAQAGIGFPKRSILVLGLMWTVFLAIALMTPASWDVAWRLEIGQRILKGAELYKDIVEVNPPLWFWAVLPSNFAANLTGISPYAMMCLTGFVMGGIGLWLLDLSTKPYLSVDERFWTIAASLVALFLIPLSDTGQREVPLLLAGLLWASLIVRRGLGIACPLWLCVAIACFCTYGFALKHYYLLVPIGLEIWLIALVRRAWRPLRSETLCLAVLGLAFGVSALKLSPHFLTDMVPLIVQSYGEIIGSTTNSPAIHMLRLLFNGLVILAPFLLARRAFGRSIFAQTLLVLLILQVVIILWQAKGFANHFLAAKGTALVLWGSICALEAKHRFARPISPRAVLAVLACGWVALPAAALLSAPSYAAIKTLSPANGDGVILQTIVREPTASRIFVLAVSPSPAFVTQWRENRPHFSRYYAMWMVPGLLKAQRDPARSAAATPLLNAYRQATIADILCAAPDIILAEALTPDDAPAQSQMSVLTTDAAFRTWLNAHYDKTDANFGVTIWRNKVGSAPVSRNCPAFQARRLGNWQDRS
jgi:hypothetical protein